MLDRTEKLIIAGPCALESAAQLRECVSIIRQMGLSLLRASLWKPRTQPGWEGLGRKGISLLLEETIPYGVTPATEIFNGEHARVLIQGLQRYGEKASMIVWLGARNQNHMEQRKIAKILAEGPRGITLMFKNQMWDDEKHWLGIFEHLIAEGFPQERLMTCHRGFSPGKVANPQRFRNLPDFEMAMRIREQTEIPMLLDPSHIGGNPLHVREVCKRAADYNFDGFLIEMHSHPERARTDGDQQLSPEQFRSILQLIGNPSEKVALCF